MTLNYSVWVSSDERPWWIETRLVIVLVVAMLLGIHPHNTEAGNIGHAGDSK